MKDIVKGTKYENIEIFRFDIGDRNSVLSLPRKLIEIRDKELEKNAKKKTLEKTRENKKILRISIIQVQKMNFCPK